MMGFVYSMTGYGSSSVTYDNKIINIELRSLNGKQADIRCRLPSSFKEREHEIRRAVVDKVYRGKLELSISLLTDGIEEAVVFNTELASRYLTICKNLATEHQVSSDHILGSILAIPNVLGEAKGTISEQEWVIVLDAIENACDELMDFRKREGSSLETDMRLRADNILELLDDVPRMEKERTKKLKDRMLKHVKEQSDFQHIDENRLEQEYIYYLEKLDITEEKIRLKEHCEYFNTFLLSDIMEKGRKLNFIAQEMGREINTLGSKAQYAELQHVVVEMKDQLEKIKEQCLNIL